MRFSPQQPYGLAALGLSALGLAALAPTMARAQTQDLFVSSLGTSNISRFAGTGPGTFSTTPTTLPGGPGGPTGLAFDAKGDLFITNFGNGSSRITELASTGAGTFGATSTLFAGNLSQPFGLAFDANGDLFAASLFGGSAGHGSITEFAATGAGTLGPDLRDRPERAGQPGLRPVRAPCPRSLHNDFLRPATGAGDGRGGACGAEQAEGMRGPGCGQREGKPCPYTARLNNTVKGRGALALCS